MLGEAMRGDGSIRIKKMCRGMGKIYALVTVPLHAANAHYEIRSVLQNGTEVPAKLISYRDDALVMVLSVLDVVQTVTIKGKDAQGNTIVSLRRPVHPNVAKFSSRIHTLHGDKDMERIRNYDVLAGFGEFGVYISRVILGQDGTDTIQGFVSCEHDNLELITSNMEVCFLTRTGEKASLDNVVIVRDSLEDLPRTRGCKRRSLQFSGRISHNLEEMIVWVRPQHGRDGLPNGFLALEKHDLTWWRDMWYVWMQPASNDPRYTECFHLDWKASPSELGVQKRTELAIAPKFSIIVPLYHTPLAYLNEMIESVLCQSYERFELILVNASKGDLQLCAAVNEWCAQDRRIVVVELEENRGITENTNAGIRAATGDFLCFLDHDDVISSDALFCYAEALNQYPETDLFYSDEDHLEEDGSHTWPFFKPDWNPDLLLGMNYVCHFMCVRKSVVDGMELPTKKYDGAQDHHMALRASEVARNIYHCRRVLYHWRVHPGSTASGVGEKPYAVEAGRLAVQSHLDRCGQDAHAIHSSRVPNRYEVMYELKKEPLVSILIPNKDAVSVLDRCLTSIRTRTDYKNYEVIIIENNSTDDKTFSYYRQAERCDSRVRVVYYDGTFNFASINNFGAQHAQGEYLLLLNNDTEVLSADWLRRLVSVCNRDSTGIVGAKLLYPDNTIQHMGVMCLPEGPDHVGRYLASDTPQDMLQLMQNVYAVTGACLMTKRAVFDEVGGLDPEFEVDYNDIDYCWKVAAAGYWVVCDPSVELYHYESISRGFHTSKESALRFEREKGLLRRRWPQHFAYADPMGSPNFDQHSLYRKLK